MMKCKNFQNLFNRGCSFKSVINTHAGSATEVAVLINPHYTDNLCVTDDLYPVIIIPKIVKSQPAPIFEIVTGTATHAFNQWQKSASLNFFQGFS